MTAELKRLHDEAGKIATAKLGRLMTTTCGTLAALSKAVKDRLPKGGESSESTDVALDAHVAFSNAAANPPQTVCRVPADRVLSLTSLLFGPAVIVNQQGEQVTDAD